MKKAAALSVKMLRRRTQNIFFFFELLYTFFFFGIIVPELRNPNFENFAAARELRLRDPGGELRGSDTSVCRKSLTRTENWKFAPTFLSFQIRLKRNPPVLPHGSQKVNKYGETGSLLWDARIGRRRVGRLESSVFFRKCWLYSNLVGFRGGLTIVYTIFIQLSLVYIKLKWVFSFLIRGFSFGGGGRGAGF